jgi:hypothetical protein
VQYSNSQARGGGGVCRTKKNTKSKTGKKIKNPPWALYINKLTLIANQFQLLLTGMLPQT